MIVLNGEPFTRYNLRGLYPYAHQIIVVEGASPDAEAVSTADGHSKDETLQVLHDFKHNEDPEGKLLIVTAEDEGHPNGFWPGEKDEQSIAYAKRATGNYLWQVDIDEFYKGEDIEKLIRILDENPSIEAVSFPMITFWGSPFVIVDSWYLRRGASTYHRLFKWKEGYSYKTHRPPTVVDEKGIDLRKRRWLNSDQLKKMGIFLYHYSLLFPRQVYEKCTYYQNSSLLARTKALDWMNNSYLSLRSRFQVHNVYSYPGWLERSPYVSPAKLKELWDDISNGKVQEPVRDMRDVDALLANPAYPIQVFVVKHLEIIDRLLGGIPLKLFKRAHKFLSSLNSRETQ